MADDLLTITQFAVGFAKSTRGDAPDPARFIWKNAIAGYMTDEDGRRWAMLVMPDDGSRTVQRDVFADARRFLDTGQTPQNCTPPRMAVIVCGGRKGQTQAFVSKALDAWCARHPTAAIIHGACEDRCRRDREPPRTEAEAIERDGEHEGWSADMCADRWADARGVRALRMPANWYPDGKNLDRGAGPRRNAEMLGLLAEIQDPKLDERQDKHGRPVAVLAFSGGSGTEGMVELAKVASVAVWRATASGWLRA